MLYIKDVEAVFLVARVAERPGLTKTARVRELAKLNMGACFAYACAKTSNATRLCKGNGFAKTDLA